MLSFRRVENLFRQNSQNTANRNLGCDCLIIWSLVKRGQADLKRIGVCQLSVVMAEGDTIFITKHRAEQTTGA